MKSIINNYPKIWLRAIIGPKLIGKYHYLTDSDIRELERLHINKLSKIIGYASEIRELTKNDIYKLVTDTLEIIGYPQCDCNECNECMCPNQSNRYFRPLKE